MKRLSYIGFLLLCFTVLISCRKKNKKEEIDLPVTVEIAGKSYSAVSVKNQLWTTSNYEGPGGIPHSTPNTKPEYGRYYSYAEIKSIGLPEGWRIPTRQDYIELAESLGASFDDNLKVLNPEVLKKLTSKSRWKNIQGNNESGFNGYPAGYSFQNSAPLDGDICEFWTSDGTTVSIQEGGNLSLRMAFYNDSGSPEYKFNVRFVKDK